MTAYVCAQDGGLDTSFGNQGSLTIDIDGGSDLAYSITQETNGKLLVAGMFTRQGQAFPSIVRLNLNGTFDSSFGHNAVATFNRTGYENESYNTVLSRSDGKIIAGGSFYTNSSFQYAIHQYLSNGLIDATFGNNGEIILFEGNNIKDNLALLNDDSLLAVGTVIDNGVSKIALKKFLPDGTLDSSFGNNGIVLTQAGNDSSSGNKLDLAVDNTIVVLGSRSDNGISSQILLRYLPNGVLDSSFGSGGIVIIDNVPNHISRSISLYNDTGIAVASSYYDYQAERNSNRIFKYLSNGSFDGSFGNNGFINPNINSLLIGKIEVQQNQRLLIFGELSDGIEGGGPFFMDRYFDSGYRDASFTFDTFSTENYVSDMLIQQDGKILCLASTPWYNGQEDIVLERHTNIPLSISEFVTQKVVIYPNPSSGIFIVEGGFYLENVPYQITDITGKVIGKGMLNKNQQEIDLTVVQRGIYFLKTDIDVFRLLKN